MISHDHYASPICAVGGPSQAVILLLLSSCRKL